MNINTLNEAISFLKDKGIRLKMIKSFSSGNKAEVEINRFHEDHKRMEVIASWGSLDFQGSTKVWDIEHPDEDEFKELL